MQTNTASVPARLEDVLAYRHPGVVRRYLKEHGGSREEAEEVFRETLKWLYLCHRTAAVPAEGLACAITPDLEKIDRMWHTFLLFTRDYAEFCDRHLGMFIHHLPESEDAAEAEGEEAARSRLARQFGLVYDVLGEETLDAWYDECRYAVAGDGPPA
jgi:hypothetical protein